MTGCSCGDVDCVGEYFVVFMEERIVRGGLAKLDLRGFKPSRTLARRSVTGDRVAVSFY
jgi:hypothetical protein